MIKNFIELHGVKPYGVLPMMVNYKRLLCIYADEDNTYLKLNDGSLMVVTESYDDIVRMIEENNKVATNKEMM